MKVSPDARLGQGLSVATSRWQGDPVNPATDTFVRLLTAAAEAAPGHAPGVTGNPGVTIHTVSGDKIQGLVLAVDGGVVTVRGSLRDTEPVHYVDVSRIESLNAFPTVVEG